MASRAGRRVTSLSSSVSWPAESSMRSLVSYSAITWWSTVCSASRGRYWGATHPMPLGSAPAPPCPCPKKDGYAGSALRRHADAPLGRRPAGARGRALTRTPPRAVVRPAPVGTDACAEEIANELEVDLSVQGVASAARACVQHSAKAPIKSQSGWDWP